jgi:hypothetical protein
VIMLAAACHQPVAAGAIPGHRTTHGEDFRHLHRRLGQDREDSVTQVIEQQMKGLDNLTYMPPPAVRRAVPASV